MHQYNIIERREVSPNNSLISKIPIFKVKQHWLYVHKVPTTMVTSYNNLLCIVR